MSQLEPQTPAAPAMVRLPLLQLILVGLQHVLLMYGGAVAVPLIIGQAAGLSREEIAFLINADLLVAGIATLVQSFGIGPVGIRMPVMMGASFAAVGSMVAMAGMPGIGLQGIFGATIAAGFFGLLIALHLLEQGFQRQRMFTVAQQIVHQQFFDKRLECLGQLGKKHPE